MGKQRAVWAVVIIVGGFVLAACGSSSPTSSGTTTTAIAPAAALATGTYVPTGSSGQPHYVITIASATDTQFQGTMKFVYQDGTSSRVFDFSGNVSGESATATPTNVAASDSATETVSSVPAMLQIAVGSDMLTFKGCKAYLVQVQTSSACTFTGSR
jgi:hypothetical protein